MNKKILITLSTLFILSGCSAQSKKEESTTKNDNAVKQERVDPDNKPHEKAMECCHKPETGEVKVVNMSGDELSKIQNDLKEKERHLVIDLRTEEEYKKGHLKYAINMPKETFKNHIGRIRDWSMQSVILYANTSDELAEAANELIKDKFQKVTIAQGVSEYTYDYVTYTNLTGSEMQKIIDKEQDFFIDSRDEKDFNKAHAKNVVRVNHKDLSNIAEVLPKDKEKHIYLYDYTGDRSVTIAEKLQELGYKNITLSLDGTKETQFYFNK